jgi:hypothetical protein
VEARIVRTSGSALLDAHARVAIPPRVEAPPGGPVVHRVAFHLRNDLLPTAAAPSGPDPGWLSDDPWAAP